MTTGDHSPHVLERIVERTADIGERLGGLDDGELRASSELPGWSRLTIVCHLRYGAAALERMTDATLKGRTTSYYPGGRSRQRPGTLEPENGEETDDVVRSLASHSARLGQVWSTVRPESWDRVVIEPEDNPDLGRIPLSLLALLRLTEVEVHGGDLGLGLGDWSTTFVDATLPLRLEALNVRKPAPRALETGLAGTWLLVASDGPTYRVSVMHGAVESAAAGAHPPPRAVLEATSRDLLALLLGRPCLRAPRVTGDSAFGEAFSAVFPGP